MTKEGIVTGSRQDALELLASDHREVEQFFSMMEAARKSGAKDEQRHIAERVVHELSVHAVAEEEILYPLMRKVLDDGDARVEDALSEHQEAKELLDRIDGADPESEDARQAWDQLVPAIKHHVKDEEDEDFPAFRNAVGQERLYELGERLAKAKQVAPTHPHPNAPNTPPGNVVAGTVASAIDRVRDALRS